MPDQTREDKVILERGNIEVSKTDTGISITDTDNRSRSLDIDFGADRSSVGITWSFH